QPIGSGYAGAERRSSRLSPIAVDGIIRSVAMVNKARLGSVLSRRGLPGDFVALTPPLCQRHAHGLGRNERARLALERPPVRARGKSGMCCRVNQRERDSAMLSVNGEIGIQG